MIVVTYDEKFIYPIITDQRLQTDELVSGRAVFCTEVEKSVDEPVDG